MSTADSAHSAPLSPTYELSDEQLGSRGRTHTAVADLLDRTDAVNDGWHLSRLREVPSTWGGRGSNPRPMDYESTALTD